MNNRTKPPPIPQPPPVPASSPPRPVVRVVPRPKSPNANDTIFRFIVVMVLAGSILLLWWTYSYKLEPLQKRSRELNSSMTRLSAEVEAMERQWSKADVEQLSTNLSQLPDRLFTGPATLETWVSNLKDQVLPLALDATTAFGKTVQPNTNYQNLALIPTTIAVEAQPARGVEGAESAYQRILRLTRTVLAQQRRADLTALTVVGGADSVSRAEIVLNLWAGEEEKP